MFFAHALRQKVVVGIELLLKGGLIEFSGLGLVSD